MTNEFDPSQEQISILNISEGRHRIIAPPGSGKTELLVQRLKKQVHSCHDLKNLACLTFTNRAARSMQLKAGDVSSEVHIGNFHALAVRLLRQIGCFKAFHTVLDEDDSEFVLNMVLDDIFGAEWVNTIHTRNDPVLNKLEKQIDLDMLSKFNMFPMGGPAMERPSSWQGCKEFKKRLLRLISAYKLYESALISGFSPIICDAQLRLLKVAMGYPIVKVEQKRPIVWSQMILLSALKVFSESYAKVKSRAFAFDYDDLIVQILKWLQNNPGLIQYNWVQVDECQDLNDLQWAILNHITNRETCLVLFADPQQSIFSFMGSELSTFQYYTEGFEKSYLNINYRSPEYLINFYRDYVNHHFEQKVEWVSNDQNNIAESNMRYITCSSDLDEQYYIATKIIPNYLEESDGNIAILGRSNRLVAQISESLECNGIDHFIVSQFDLFRLRVTKDFMSFLQSIHSPETKLPWVRLLAGSMNISLKDSFKIVNSAYESGSLPHWFLEGYLESTPSQELMKLTKKARVVVFDTETTGKDPYCDDIIQIAAIEICSGVIGQELNLYLKTEKDLGTSTEIHKISPETLTKKGRERNQVFSEFLDFIGSDPICAHNMMFDLTILDINLRAVFGENHGFLSKNPIYCTLEITRAIDPYAPNHKLATLIERYNLEGKNTHNALDDVKATVNLILALEGRIYSMQEKSNLFYKKYYKAMKSLDKKIGDVWRSLRKSRNSQVEFSTIFELFLNLKLNGGYEFKHIDECKKKLINHMKETTSPAPIHKILNKELHRYLLYREPDLILDSDRIVVSTIHRAKGLEFETVIIPSCHSNSYPIYPATLDKSGEKIEEEKRILFVALTRAEKRLVIIQPNTATTVRGKGMNVSISEFLEPFIGQFQKENLPLKYSIYKNSMRDPYIRHQCSECGWGCPWDMSSKEKVRCFGCGHVQTL